MKIKSEINVTSSNDLRSYRQNSDNISTGFTKYCIDDAIDEIIKKFKDGKLSDQDIFYNIKIMKKNFQK